MKKRLLNGNPTPDENLALDVASEEVILRTLSEKEFAMPIDGEIIPLSEVPDDVFAQGMMGAGFGIIPTGDTVYSPFDGKVVSVFPTKHAIGLVTDTGIEVLIHVGLDTVKLKGKGFDLLVEEGQLLQSGDALLKLDLAYLGANSTSMITPVIFTNLESAQLHMLKQGNQRHGDTSILKIGK